MKREMVRNAGSEPIDFHIYRTAVACCCCILVLGRAEQGEERSFFLGGWAAPPSSDSSLFEASMAWPEQEDKRKQREKRGVRTEARADATGAK
jgi:hypothetical protein